MSDVTRDTLDSAYVELSAQTGASGTDLCEAALELAGHSGSSTFGSTMEEVRAIAQLARGLSDGSLAAGRTLTEDEANAEHQRLAALHGSDLMARDPGAVRFDQRKLARHLYAGAPVAAPPPGRQPASLTAAQEAETDRLLALSGELARPVPAALRLGQRRPLRGAAGGRGGAVACPGRQ